MARLVFLQPGYEGLPCDLQTGRAVHRIAPLGQGGDVGERHLGMVDATGLSITSEPVVPGNMPSRLAREPLSIRPVLWT